MIFFVAAGDYLGVKPKLQDTGANAVQLTQAIYKDSVLFFVAFFAIVVWGFWATYFVDPFQNRVNLLHTHAITMTLWCAMLVSQAFMIRTHRRTLHRWVGRSSYILAPVMVLVMALLSHRFGRRLVDPYLLLFYVLGAAFLFGLFYFLAVVNRHRPDTHARFMICTVFPLYSAATDRVIRGFMDGLFTLPMHILWFLGDIVLLSLAVWDWRAHRRLDVFPLACGLMFSYHLLVFIAPEIPIWRTFLDWFLGLGV